MYVPPTVKPLCPPEEKPRFEDVPYATVKLDNGQDYTLKLDIYQSAGQSKPGPCIIYIFGGGFMWGEYKQVTQKAVYCRDLVRLTKEGYTVVCPDYRLVSQSIFPACINDVKGVVRFLKANGEKYNIDPERIGALGNSAGGCLAAMLALSSKCGKEMWAATWSMTAPSRLRRFFTLPPTFARASAPAPWPCPARPRI